MQFSSNKCGSEWSHSAGFFSRAARLLLVVSLSLFTPLSAEERKLSTTENSTDCNQYLRLSKSGNNKPEHYFTIAALKECPTSPEIRLFLEETIRTANENLRPVALTALSGHLNGDSLDTLVTIYHQQKLTLKEEEIVLEYLHKLATPAKRSELRPIFRRSLNRIDLYKNTRNSATTLHGEEQYRIVKQILTSSLLGLGRVGGEDDWLRLKSFFNIDENELSLVAMQSAASLELEQPESVNAALIRKLLQPEPQSQAMAIKLLAARKNSKIIHELVQLYYRGCHSNNRTLLYNTLHQIFNNPAQERYGVITTTTRLHVAPFGDSHISAVIPTNTVIQIVSTKKDEDTPGKERPDGKTANLNWQAVQFRNQPGWILKQNFEFTDFSVAITPDS